MGAGGSIELVSVIVPTWQREAKIGRCLEAILGQRGPRIELLVVDDGSTDGTRERVAAIHDDRVRFIGLSHQGSPARVRNVGIEAARGELVAFCDSDDTWLADKLARGIAVFEDRPDATLVASRARLVDEAQRELGEFPEVEEAGDIALARLVAGNVIPCSAAVARREVVLSAGGFPEDPRADGAEDYGLWLALAQRGDFVVLPDVAVLHERHPGCRSLDRDREARAVAFVLALASRR